MTLTRAQQLDLASWSEADRASYEETASHRQFDGGELRDDAEVAAYLEVKRNRAVRTKTGEG